MKKYIVVEDYVMSKTDGDTHFISAEKLMKLYKVKPEECRIIRFGSGDFVGLSDINLKTLRPRFDGNYSLEALTKGDGR